MRQTIEPDVILVVTDDMPWPCLHEGQRVVVKANEKRELYVMCDHGKHYLEPSLRGLRKETN